MEILLICGFFFYKFYKFEVYYQYKMKIINQCITGASHIIHPFYASAGGGSSDGGRSRSLVDPTQGAIPGGQIVGVDENDNTIVEVLPSSSRQG